tara:strand:+ start:241 stop:747 length:507 start_codon:yes stop_codon:yes gene_type:complete
MKYFFLIIIFIFSFTKPFAYADQNLAFIDLDYVLKNSNFGKNKLKKIENFNSKNIDILKKKEDELKKKEDEINSKKNIITKEQLNKDIEFLKTQIRLFKTEKDQLVNDFNKKRNDELKDFFEQINPIIQNYMDQLSIDILLDRKNVFIGNVSSDITKKIVNEINNKIK